MKIETPLPKGLALTTVDRLFEGVDVDHREHRTEDLFGDDRIVLLDVVEDGRADVGAFGVGTVRVAAVEHDFRPVLDRAVDPAVDPVPGVAGNHRADIDAFLEAVADR